VLRLLNFRLTLPTLFLALVAIILSLLYAQVSHAAIITASGFELNGKLGSEVTATSTTNAPDMETASLTRGAGISATALANAFAANSFIVGGNKASAIAGNEFFQVTLQSKNCVPFSLKALNFHLRRSSTGPNAYQWQYSFDGFATSGTDVGAEGSYTGTGTNGAAMPEIDLSSVAALQNIQSGVPVTFRIYFWGASGGTGSMALGRLSGNDLSFTAQFGPDNLLEYELNGQPGDQVSQTPSIIESCIKSADMTRGPGLNSAALTNAFSANGFTVGGTKSDAISNDDYLQILIDAKDGSRLNLYELNYIVRRSPQGPNTFQWQYSLDGFLTSGTDIGSEVTYSGTDNLGLVQTPIALNDVNLQNKKTITLRLYAWGASSGAGTFAIGRQAGPDLQISGTISPNYIIHYSASRPITPGSPPNQNLTPLPAIIFNTLLNPSDLSRGLGLSSVSSVNTFISDNFTISADKSTAISQDEFYQFNFTSDEGYYANLSAIYQTNNRSDTGPTEYQWQYSLDGFATPGIDVGNSVVYTGTDPNGEIASSTAPFTIPALQNVTSVTFRVYAWGASASTGTFGFGSMDYELSLTGEVYIFKNNVNYGANQGGFISGSSTQLVDYGSSTVAVTATPYNGNKFTVWSDGRTDNPRLDISVTSTASYVANFEAIQVTSTTAGAGGFTPPSGKGSGQKDVTLEINEKRDIGIIDQKGINLLAKIGSRADYALASYPLSKYSFFLNDVDLRNNRVSFQIIGTNYSATIGMNEVRTLDLNYDGIDDFSIQFFDVYINRIEFILRELAPTAIRKAPVQPVQEKTDKQAAFQFTRELRSGFLGEDVRRLQIFLNSKGFLISKQGPGSPGQETTRFGAFTRDALIKFQQANQILATGILGPVTRNLINSLIRSSVR